MVSHESTILQEIHALTFTFIRLTQSVGSILIENINEYHPLIMKKAIRLHPYEKRALIKLYVIV